MNITFVLLLMFFAHIVDDFYLQGILANMKQKSWWEKHPDYNKKYENDFVMAMFIHAFSWTFMIMLPIAMYLNFNIDISFVRLLLWNLMLHAVIDNFKANCKTINLVCDQCSHIGQILLTYYIFIFYMT